jgi:hypothetical protein
LNKKDGFMNLRTSRILLAIALAAVGQTVLGQTNQRFITPVAATFAGGGGCADPGCTDCASGGCASRGLLGAAPDCATQGGCGVEACCCNGLSYNFAVYGEFLYLRARDAEVAYAVEVNNAVAPPAIPLPVQAIGVVDPDYEPAFRFGMIYALDCTSSIDVKYTMFESDGYHRTDLVTAGNEIQSLLTHPSTAQAAQGGLFADAQHDISFNLIDVDYRQVISKSCCHETTFLIGVRYGDMEQNLKSNLPILGNETVDTDIDFYGAGLRMGLEYQRHMSRGLSAYGKLHGSLLAGDWRADYDQGSNFDASVVDTAWQAGRITPVLDLEVGMGWTSCDGCWHFAAGYTYSAWYNGLNTDEWVDSVRSNNYADMDSNITFDGLTSRVEMRF